MEINLEQVLNNVSGHLKDMAKTETIIGEEFKMGEFTCKPVIKVGVGFGSGMGDGIENKTKNHGKGTGAGGGIGIAPVGFLVTKGKEISFIPASQTKGLSAIFEKVPDLIEKVMEMKNKQENESDAKN